MIPLRVVLADDHEMVRLGLRSLVDSSPGIEVVGEARDGEEACRRARELRPDILVIDVSMPRLDGAAATERVTRECPGVRVIALTAHDGRAHLTRLLQAGAAGYVLKRSAPDELIRAIRAVASGGTYVDPQLAGSVLGRLAARASGAIGAIGVAPAALSAREEEVLRQIAWGHSNTEIASQLGISTRTVETYRARIAEKTGLRSRTERGRFALEQGWLSETWLRSPALCRGIPPPASLQTRIPAAAGLPQIHVARISWPSFRGLKTPRDSPRGRRRRPRYPVRAPTLHHQPYGRPPRHQLGRPASGGSLRSPGGGADSAEPWLSPPGIPVV